MRLPPGLQGRQRRLGLRWGRRAAPAGGAGPGGPLLGRGGRPPLRARVARLPPQLPGSHVVSVVQCSLRKHSPLGHRDHASVQTNQPPKLESACGEPPLWGPLCGLAGCSQSKGPRVSPGPLRTPLSGAGVSLGPPKPGSRDPRVPSPCSSFSSSILKFHPLLLTYIFGHLFIQSICQGWTLPFFIFTLYCGVVKEPACQSRRRKSRRLSPWAGKVPGGGHGNLRGQRVLANCSP